ncbi:acetyl-CoA hydrolase/transferase family protein [Sporomusa termitida]|uniref:Probable butyrate:acetyl-CoA coenzyme A-transferase n=1 Tax=Sporomusa termitida TaxID=2377 RepID=A0A517DYK4_9FIRM|nr:acetyl-CoA hydrolase/transferase C-terminal domain-containing protein [Sporomusa termitida]QDR82432.1 Butanoate coenzyme A-transferase [Sporomusa termitida]
MNLLQEYRSKLVSAEKAVKVIKAGDWVDYNFVLSQPVLLDKALAARKDELRDVKIRGGMRLTPLEVVEIDPNREHFCYNSWHFSAYERQLSDRGLCNYIPMIYRNMPLFYRKSLEVDVAMFTVAPMSSDGYFNFSLTNSASKAIAEQAKIVILEINKQLPVITGGQEEGIHIREIDYIVEGDNPELPVINPVQVSDTDKKIAQFIMREIKDGSTIQLGVGALPNAVGTMIAESDLKNLGMHTEMLVDAYMTMTRAGKITNTLKNINKGKGVFSFCAGSKDLYEWTNDNPALISVPIDYANDPHTMAKNDNLVTINNCVEVDILGQVTAETAGSRQLSGTGGQLDFLTGGYLSQGGKSFICFTSTFTDKRTGQMKSRVLKNLPLSSVVTNPRTQAHYLVTEWGVADLAGRSTWERAERIINIAHPAFREDLIRAAEQLGIWRQSNKHL